MLRYTCSIKIGKEKELHVGIFDNFCYVNFVFLI